MISTEAKPRFFRATGILVARELCEQLKPCCARLIVAGSLRRRKQSVGDVEILYVPSIVNVTHRELFATPTNFADLEIADLERRCVLRRRLNANGSETFGQKNKLMEHTLTGMPVDLFEATELNWWNYLVCRTGPAASNTLIASRARDKGWKWKPYDPGFVKLAPGPLGSLIESDEWHVVQSERDVFDFVGLHYREPWER